MPRRSGPLNPCQCGCGALVANRFRQGHDAILKGQLLRLARAGNQEAYDRLVQLGWLRFLNPATAGSGTTARVRSTRSTAAVANTLPQNLYGISLTRRFGVELEFFGITRATAISALRGAGLSVRDESYNHTTRSHWKLITDGSVNARGTGESQGLELVSPPLQGLEGLAQVKRACEALRAAGANVDRTCGTHVHHEVTDFTSPTQFGNVMANYRDLQPAIDQLVPASRRSGGSNQYVGPIGEYQISTVYGMSSLLHVSQSSYNRYCNVNLASYGKYGTIEFRQMGGTLSYSKLAAWIALGQAIIQKSAEGWLTDYTNSVISMTQRLGANEALTRWVTERADELAG